jgi:hypothetical protein
MNKMDKDTSQSSGDLNRKTSKDIGNEKEPSRRSGSMDSSSGDRKSNLGEQSDVESSSWADRKNEH